MQVGLIRLVQKTFPPGAKISVLSVFGANQPKALQQEYDHSSKYPLELLSGLKPTFYPLGNKKQGSELFTEIRNAAGFLPCLLLLLALRAGISPRLAAGVLSPQARKTLLAIADADLVIWNGRNFRCRNNPALEVFRTLHLVYHPLVALALHKKIACVGASVWPMNSPAARRILRAVFQKCYFISLRESESFLQTQQLLGKIHTLHLLPDLSLAAFDTASSGARPELQENRENLPQKVGFTLVDWNSQGEEARSAYIQAIRGCMQALIRGGSELVIVPQVTKKWEHFSSLWNEISQGLSETEKSRIRRIEGEPTIDQLLETYRQLDFLIATRMHSAIFATLARTPLIAIAYDQGGKWNILKDIGYTDYLLPYDGLSTGLLLERVTHFWAHRKAMLANIYQNTVSLQQKVDLNMSMLVAALDAQEPRQPALTNSDPL